MYERASHLQQFLITWMLVSDYNHAQIYEYHKTMQKLTLEEVNNHHYYDEKSGHEVAPVPNGFMEAESIDNYQIRYDRRGTPTNGNGITHNNNEPYKVIMEKLNPRFIKVIASKLQQACANNSFDRLVLVAQAKMIGEIMEQLNADVQDRIVGVLPKNYTDSQNDAGLNYLREKLA